MHRKQFALGFVHFSLRIPLECTCTAVLWPKFSDTSLSLGKCMCRCAFLVLRVLKMGSKILYFSLPIPLECTCTAAFWPKFSDTSLLLKKTDVSLCILVPRVPEMSVNISSSVVQNPPSGAHFLYDRIAPVVCRPGAESIACYGWRVEYV